MSLLPTLVAPLNGGPRVARLIADNTGAALRAADDADLVALSNLGHTAGAALSSARSGSLALPNVHGMDPEGAMVSELQFYFRRWHEAKLAEGATETDFAAWARSATNGRPGVLLKALFGTDVHRLGSALLEPAIRHGDLWTSLSRVYPAAVGDQVPAIVGLLTNPTNRLALLSGLGHTEAPAELERRLDLMIRVWHPAGLATVTDHVVRAAIGSRNQTPEEFCDVLLRAWTMLSKDVGAGKVTLDGRLLPAVAPETVLLVDGIGSFFAKALTRSGYENGARFEVFVHAWKIALAGDGLATNAVLAAQEAAARSLRMEIPLPRRTAPGLAQGPDLGQRIGNFLKLGQMKSVASWGNMMRESNDGALWGQVESMIERLALQRNGARPAPFMAPDAAGVWLPVDRELELFIDKMWVASARAIGSVSLGTTPATRAFEAALNAHLATQATRLRLEGPGWHLSLPPFTVKVYVL